MLRYFLIRTIINNAHILGKNTILGPTEAIFKEQTAVEFYRLCIKSFTFKSTRSHTIHEWLRIYLKIDIIRLVEVQFFH